MNFDTEYLTTLYWKHNGMCGSRIMVDHKYRIVNIEFPKLTTKCHYYDNQDLGCGCMVWLECV